jgi:hypothetical protein
VFFKTKTDKSTVNVEIDIKVSEIKPETKPEPPAPDLATKPADIVGYCFGYVCPAHHVTETFEKITVEEFDQRRACSVCGDVARPATVKRTAEAQWRPRLTFAGLYSTFMCEDTSPTAEHKWRQHDHEWNRVWTKHEFIKFLVDLPTKKTKKQKAR